MRSAAVAAGKRVSGEVRAFRSRHFAAAMADWSDEDRRAFARLLTRFTDALGRTAG
jgi:hypothetical protein